MARAKGKDAQSFTTWLGAIGEGLGDQLAFSMQHRRVDAKSHK